MKNFLVAFSFCFVSVSWGFDVPKLTGPVVDEARLLSPSERSSLEELIRAAHSKGVIQLQVAILKNLQGEPIESASIKITDAWKLGDAKKDNGVLFLIALEDKKMRIEVGQGLEGAIPDLIARRILQSKVQPLFRQGQFGQGIYQGVVEIIKRANQESTGDIPEPEPEPQNRKGWMFFLYLLIFVIFTMSRMSRRAFGSRRSGYWGGPGGFGGGFGGGGGGWSGGGGGFSGGGSSSDW